MATRTAPPAARLVSVAPDGAEYPLPTANAEHAALRTIAEGAERYRQAGREIVVVQGLGFVGSAVAAVLAGARAENGQPLFFVIGVDVADPSSYWKVAKVNSGESPVVSPDAELDALLAEAAGVNLFATTSGDAYALADVIVVDVHLSVENRVAKDPSDITVEMDGFRKAIRSIGRTMRTDALVLVETTVPIGACETVVDPILREERLARGISEPPLVAHAYERVMPGPRYVASIQRFPRTFAGMSPAAAARARAFLSSFIDTDSHPLWELPDTTSSELAKLLENSYRAASIAFIHEWTLLAEAIGVDLFQVVDSIRVRVGTHDNMRYPGFGVGGYCLTKDPLLAQWGALNLLASPAALEATLAAVETNFFMPLHAFDLAEELGGDLRGKSIAVCGLAYTAGVADTRNTATELLVERLTSAGATVRVHDPIVKRWPEVPAFVPVNLLSEALSGADGAIFAVPHSDYTDIESTTLAKLLAPGAFVVDAHNVLDDETARRLHDEGVLVAGVGKGHWRKQGFGGG
jgi:nucleotide sugar dehydrogenase